MTEREQLAEAKRIAEEACVEPKRRFFELDAQCTAAEKAWRDANDKRVHAAMALVRYDRAHTEEGGTDGR